MSTSEFTVVTKKQRKPKTSIITERILVCCDAPDYLTEDWTFCQDEITSIKDLEAFATRKQLKYWYHGFSVDRQLIFTYVRGKLITTTPTQQYLDHVIKHSNAPDDVKDLLDTFKI